MKARGKAKGKKGATNKGLKDLKPTEQEASRLTGGGDLLAAAGKVAAAVGSVTLTDVAQAMQAATEFVAGKAETTTAPAIRG